ncbi:low temperature requirement protein A [Streptomyces yaanensis]|uniref:Low temperature requirement protein A n=1 Tax=Streptomyces yaanensis TaxID=1142239 RepID=A0ABV7S4R4_9ACTN|nr:low temperature requirement protein A [Streptomyces sp. CGMCC 4.7035]WNB99669.1 low temperature requirement protein A [Streptomyces sp. CGMCC 4.7035]
MRATERTTAFRARRRLWAAESASGRVTEPELFFDLVFVFMVTQVTHAVETHPGWEGLLKGLFPLVVAWWMFSGFGWLTNAVRPDAVPVRLLLTLAMMAFFIMGLDVPYAFEPEGWAFALAYLAVVAIHCLVYVTTSVPSARQAIIRNAPFNAVAGVLVLLAPHLPETSGWIAWAAAVVVLYLSPFLGRIRGFVIEPHHFVERHALLLLVVLGESVVAVGIGAQSPQSHPVGTSLALGVALGISVASGVWWVYFDGDETKAESEFEKAPEHRRQMLAYYAFTGGHLVMIVGIILVAAGITDAIHHFDGHANRWWLGSGTAVFLVGHAIYRALLGSGRIVDRLVGATGAVPLGTLAGFAGWAGMTAVTGVLAGVAAVDHHLMARNP